MFTHALYAVAKVKLICHNIQFFKCCFTFSTATRLSNFQIGTTNTSPQARAPAIGNYQACAHVGGALAAGETRSITCNGKGRYVIVQLKGRNYLTLCEVEVYGGMYKGPKQHKFTLCLKKKIIEKTISNTP